MQREVGLLSVTDVEFRRTAWHIGHWFACGKKKVGTTSTTTTIALAARVAPAGPVAAA
jgi:hypothetical protein